MKIFSTVEVAKAVGIHVITLEKWLKEQKVTPPKRLKVGRRVVRLWTKADLERVREYKQENYRKGRGRKAKLTK